MPLREDILNPIPGDNPSGANLRYDPIYDKIKEARREDDDAPQGEWQRERKTADFKTVISLAGDALATRSKDLQLAAWLTEALLRQQGFSGLRQGIDLLRGLLENFWDTLYPEIDEGDLDFRAAPLGWVGMKLDGPLRKAPMTRGGFSYYDYQDSRRVGYEDQADTDARREERASKIAEGKLAPEDFDKDAAATPVDRYEGWVAALDGGLESLGSLDQFCEQKFGSSAPGFSPLRTAMEEVRHIVNQILQRRLEQEGLAPAQEGTEPAPEDEPAEASSAPARATTTRRAAPAGNLDPQDADDAAARLAAVAKYLRTQDASSPAPYLMLRGYRWGELRGCGDSPDPSALVAPPSETRQNLRKLALEGNWSEVLEAAENAMAQPCGRAWLDLQRYVVRAAENYGYNAVAQAVRSELRALLCDLPQLPSWTLMDDTPAANAETQAFLKELGAAAENSSTALATDRRMDDEDEESLPGDAMPPDTYNLALDAVRSGRAGEAIQLLSDEIARQQSGRARFQRKLQLAQICMMTGHEALARPILEELARTIDAHRLEEWETAGAVAHPLTLLYRCLSKVDGDAGAKQKLYAQISRLDPVQALECER